MRMWMINPKHLCSRHLLGEHVELHMFVGTLNKGISVKGYLDKGELEIHNIESRHQELVEEMKYRGMNHKSELPKFQSVVKGCVDKENSYRTLQTRCRACKVRREQHELQIS